MKNWTFNLKQAVKIKASGAVGEVEGRAEYVDNELDMYYVHYTVDGATKGDWFREDTLEVAQ